MANQNYTCRMEAPVSPQAAFDGINNVRGWWAQNFEGSSIAAGDVFTVRFGETSGTFRLTEMQQGSKVVWCCEDCYLDLLKDKTEWKGTSIVWEISAATNAAVIKMTHIGLVPGKECYNDCEQGWNFFINESLLKFLTQSKGQPGDGIRATISRGERVYRGILYPKSGGVRPLEPGSLVLDVKATNVEQVTAIYSVHKALEESVDPVTLKGSHFMVIESNCSYGNIDPLEDLLFLV